MKCTKCGEEWTTPPGKSVNFCPNCGVPTLKPASTASSTDNVIKFLVTTNHLKDGLFLEPSILHSLASDKLQGSRPELLKYIEFAIFEKVPQELYALKSVDEHERLLKMNVILKSLMKNFNENTSYEIVNLFAEALGFSLLKTEANRKQPDSEKTLTQNGVSDNSTVQVKPGQSSGIIVKPKIGSTIHFAGRDWLVLDIKNGKALILSEKVIMKKEYNEEQTKTTWAECTLQSYLNGEFYNTLGQEKSRIAKTRIVTPNNPWYGTNGGKDIDNWIFLLSIEEVVQYLCGIQNVQEYLNKSKVKNDWWIDDEYNEKRKANDDTDAASWWWLRSPGGYSSDAAYVGSGGGLRLGRGVSVSGGVRPALWLNL